MESVSTPRKRKIRDFILKPIAVVIGYIFYSPKYLKGRHFGKGYTSGWKWVLKCFFMQKIVGVNRRIPFPVDFRMNIANWENIIFHIDDVNIFQKSGTYFQASEAKIYFGKGSLIASGTGIITTNHDLVDLTVHAPGKDIRIGDGSWVGYNSIILSGVTLGEHTVVAAGSVVTKSFPDGWCVIGGVPAKEIKKIEKE